MEDASGLFSLELSSSDETKYQQKTSRDYQSVDNFQQQISSWKPKVENGQIWKSLSLPVDNPSKPESQIILHAIEELYFKRCYRDAERLTKEALEGELPEDFRKTLAGYLESCRAKLPGPNS